MPTNLGQLPSNVPLTNNRVQIKRGAADASVNYNTSTAQGTTILDSNGAGMQIVYRPVYPCYWIVRSNVMAHGYPDGSGWRRWDHTIRITPADADGILIGFQCPHQVYDNSTVEWRTSASTALFRLNAGTTYTAYLAHEYITKGTVQVHVGPQWCRIMGMVVGEGV